MTTYIPPTVYERHATVARVVDGDTMHIVADLGCDTTLAMIVRLYGINCPELPTDEGKAATAFAQAWIDANGPTFVLRTVRDRKEKYGRWLADLVPLAGGESLCAALLTSGNAVVYLP